MFDCLADKSPILYQARSLRMIANANWYIRNHALVICNYLPTHCLCQIRSTTRAYTTKASHVGTSTNWQPPWL